MYTASGLACAYFSVNDENLIGRTAFVSRGEEGDRNDDQYKECCDWDAPQIKCHN
jgi:hypothetical protein